MSYFSAESISFFEELAGNNHKERFHANRDRYESFIKGPMKALTQEIINRVMKLDPGFYIEPKHAIFRINRDIRFAKDKTPYKTHVAAAINYGGRKHMYYPGLYIHFGLDGVWLACGCYQPDKEQLHLIRQALIDNYDQAKKLLHHRKFRSLFGAMKGQKNKILPKEFKEYKESHPLVLHKQFYHVAEYPAQEMTRKDIVDRIMTHRKAADKWNQFLVEAMELEPIEIRQKI